MRVLVLIAWGVTVLAVFIVTLVSGLSDTDRDGRVSMPGKTVLHLEARSYGLWYEEPHSTGEHESFEPPKGIEVSVRPVENEPDPIVKLGGIGSQVGTGNRTAETFGKLTVRTAGDYRLTAGSPPSGAASITVGPTAGEGLGLGAKRAGYLSVAFLALLLLVEIRRRTRPEPAAQLAPAFAAMPAFMPATTHSAQDVLSRGTPATATVVNAQPLPMSAPDGTPLQMITLQIPGSAPATAGQRVPAAHASRVFPGAQLPVRVDPGNPHLVAIDWGSADLA